MQNGSHVYVVNIDRKCLFFVSKPYGEKWLFFLDGRSIIMNDYGRLVDWVDRGGG